MGTTDIIFTLHLRKLKCRFKVLPNAIHNESAEKLKLTHTLNYFSIDSQTLVYIIITWMACYELWFLPGNSDAGILWSTSWSIPLNTKRSIHFLLKVLFALYVFNPLWVSGLWTAQTQCEILHLGKCVECINAQYWDSWSSEIENDRVI